MSYWWSGVHTNMCILERSSACELGWLGLFCSAGGGLDGRYVRFRRGPRMLSHEEGPTSGPVHRGLRGAYHYFADMEALAELAFVTG